MKTIQKIFLVVAFFVGTFSTQAQQTLSPELLWKLGRITEHTVSPDGKLVAYGVRTFDVPNNRGITDLYILNIATGEVKQVSSIRGNKSGFKFRPDGLKLAFIANPNGADQVFEVNLSGEAPIQITNEKEGVANFNYSKSINKVYFTKEIQIYKNVKDVYPDLNKANAKIIDGLIYRHWNTWEDGAFSHVFVADYINGKVVNAKDIMPNEPFDCPLAPMGGEEQINISSDGKFIAYTCKKLEGTAYAVSTNSDIYLYDVQKGTTTNISSANKGYDIEPRFSPNGKYIAWLSMETDGYEADKNRLFLYDVEKKLIQDLTTELDQNAASPCWSADSKTIFFGTGIKATEQIYRVTIADKKIVPCTFGDHDIGSFALSGDDQLVYNQMDISHPSELYVQNFMTGAKKQLTNVTTNTLSAVKMGKVEKRMVKATDGKDILTWVIYPPNFDPNKKYPTLLYCQGGPQSTVSQFFSYRWNFQLMAAQGYIVVAPNRRGLPSFGQEWNRQISGDWGGQAMKDLLSAIDDVSKEKYVDTARRAAVGASFGGYAVYWLAGNHNNRFKSFIAHCGVFNLESMYGTTEETFFNNFDFEGPYWQTPQPKSYSLFSPHKFVQNWNTPILVIHCEKDFRVPLEQGMQAFTAAQLRGIKSKFLYFEDEGHWVTKPQNSILWQREFFKWLNETLNK